MKIFLDDKRPCPDGWILASQVEDVIQQLDRGGVKAISLDYNLGLADTATGYEVLTWLEEKVLGDEDFVVPKITIHTADLDKKLLMEQAARIVAKMSFVGPRWKEERNGLPIPQDSQVD